MEPLTALRVEYKGKDRTTKHEKTTSFLFRTCLAEEQLEIFELIRPGLDVLTGIDWPDFDTAASGTKEDEAKATMEFMRSAIGAISAISIDLVKRLRGELFKYVLYQKEGQPGARVVAGEVGQAFEFLTGYHIYEVLVRSLIVNFSDFFAAGSLRFGFAMPALNLPSTLTSTPS